MDTIFSLATAQGRAGVAVIRISGPEAWDVARMLCGSLPAPRETSIRRLQHEDFGVIDEALVLPFRGPGSFTGEDVVEFHTHGSIAVCQAVLRALGTDTRARMAEPGEFTRRALENNRLDLAQVEGLADLIDAETEAQRKQATRVFSGALTESVEDWRRRLIRAASLLEATIDFADEEVPVDVTPEVMSLLQEVSASLAQEITGSYVAERIRAGFEVAIVGPPNAGKSTLLNRLAGKEAAITSEVAGTTRDVVEVRMDLGGLPVIFLDTAGLRETEDVVEKIGIERARQRAKQADLRVFLTDEPSALGLERTAEDIAVVPKCDIYPATGIGVSGRTGAGVDDLIARIKAVFVTRSKASGLATHERHRQKMVLAQESILQAQEFAQRGSETYDLAAEELRFATRALESLVGRIDVENLLDEIFASFCLGK